MPKERFKVVKCGDHWAVRDQELGRLVKDNLTSEKQARREKVLLVRKYGV